MGSELEHLDLIDLISARYFELRKWADQKWDRHSTTYISNSEWSILGVIYACEQTTIVNISKKVDISRQATHKFVNRLNEKGLVEIRNLAHNKKQKSISLSSMGEKFVKKNETLKSKLEQQIGGKIDRKST